MTDKISEEDALVLEKLALEFEVLQAKTQALMARRELIHEQMVKRYEVGASDQLDLPKRMIVRAPLPPKE